MKLACLINRIGRPGMLQSVRWLHPDFNDFSSNASTMQPTFVKSSFPSIPAAFRKLFATQPLARRLYTVTFHGVQFLKALRADEPPLSAIFRHLSTLPLCNARSDRKVQLASSR